MKAITCRKNQLGIVEGYLAQARPKLQTQTFQKGTTPEFYMLIAMEQMVEYFKLVEKELE